MKIGKRPKIRWWLMSCDLPDLNWARQTIKANGKVEIFDSDGNYHHFLSEEESTYWLTEDEFFEFGSNNGTNADELGNDTREIKPPSASNDLELVPLMKRSFQRTKQDL